MKKYPYKIIIISIFILLIINGFVFVYLQYQKQKNIDLVYETSQKTQENIENIDSIEDLYLQINGENVIGVIKIEKIGFKGLVYEGTTMDTLDKGIGHFESSPIFEGNVCLAGHNYYNIWKNLYTLEKGDNMEYTCILGQKNYSVYEVKQIENTDISVLDNTADNIVTLITCIENNPSKRLCVQAKEI